jgi:hypothetical protein
MLIVVLAGLAIFIVMGQLTAAKYVTLVFEAEDVQNLSGKEWFVKKRAEDTSGKVSGNKVLAVRRCPPGEKPKLDEVVYKVNIPQAGIYYLWARTFWANGCGNSFLFNMDEEKGKSIIGGDATYNSMHWVCWKDNADPRPLKLKKGEVTFIMGSKESATEIDQFLLTTDPEMYPANIYKPTPNLLVKEVKK